MAIDGVVRVTTFSDDTDPYLHMDFREIVADRYDFPDDFSTEGAVGPLLLPGELRSLHDHGEAQEFDIWGVGSLQTADWNGFHEEATLQQSTEVEDAVTTLFSGPDYVRADGEFPQPLRSVDAEKVHVKHKW